jgi:hypothetical protein
MAAAVQEDRRAQIRMFCARPHVRPTPPQTAQSRRSGLTEPELPTLTLSQSVSPWSGDRGAHTRLCAPVWLCRVAACMRVSGNSVVAGWAWF